MDLKIVSWNVNGLQNVLKKDANGTKETIAKLRREERPSSLACFLQANNADIVCLQEVRCGATFDHEKHLSNAGYQHSYTNLATSRKGYSGTIIASKVPARKITRNFEELNLVVDDNSDLHDLLSEGRIMTIYLDDCIVVNTYVPNSGVDGLQRLRVRIAVWEPLMLRYLTYLKTINTNIIIMGDLNVVAGPLDWRMATHLENNDSFAGATTQERNAFSELLNTGFVDTYRYFNPTKNAITWYCCRERFGCRLDYGIVATELLSKVVSSPILTNYRGSDHYPISVTLRM